MNLFKYLFGESKCTDQCRAAFDALDDQAEIVKSLKNELHERSDQIMSLAHKVQDRQSHINRLQDQLNKILKNKNKPKKQQTVAERPSNEESNCQKTPT